MTEANDPQMQGMDPRFIAGVQLLERTGCAEFQIRFDDEQEPVVWVACARYDRARIGMGDGDAWKLAAALHPLAAVMKLCEEVIDGGMCKHCGRPTSFLPDLSEAGLLDALTCVYQWDPELATFRRSCEGDAP